MSSSVNVDHTLGMSHIYGFCTSLIYYASLLEVHGRRIQLYLRGIYAHLLFIIRCIICSTFTGPEYDLDVDRRRSTLRRQLTPEVDLVRVVRGQPSSRRRPRGRKRYAYTTNIRRHQLIHIDIHLHLNQHQQRPWKGVGGREWKRGEENLRVVRAEGRAEGRAARRGR